MPEKSGIKCEWCWAPIDKIEVSTPKGYYHDECLRECQVETKKEKERQKHERN